MEKKVGYNYLVRHNDKILEIKIHRLTKKEYALVEIFSPDLKTSEMKWMGRFDLLTDSSYANDKRYTIVEELDPKDPYYRQRKLERILKLADEEKLEKLLNLLEETK
ncbi:MAG: hypothetical protein M0R46_11625 [Candidatus Muirbacterium halophilum]|nr:hypothetical protein [Candidatus Muirbacterium halophilum]